MCGRRATSFILCKGREHRLNSMSGLLFIFGVQMDCINYLNPYLDKILGALENQNPSSFTPTSHTGCHCWIPMLMNRQLISSHPLLCLFHSRTQTVCGDAEQEVQRTGCPAIVQRKRGDWRVHSAEGPAGPEQGLRVCHIFRKAVRGGSHKGT